MQKLRRIMTFFLLLGFLLGSIQVSAVSAPPPPTESELDTAPPPPEEIDPALEQALLNQIQTTAKTMDEVLAFVMFDIGIDHVEYAPDGKTALLWLKLIDPDTGEVIAAEPGLAIAKIDSNAKIAADGGTPWDITMQANENWELEFNSLPQEMLTEDMITRFSERPEEDIADAKSTKAVYRGYKLPWAGGLGKRLSGSIGHFLIYNSCTVTDCRYAYDFADGTMFPLLASRGGTVYKYKMSCNNYDSSCSNYLVLKDESTEPTTYQLYLHNAHESLPQDLRTIGAQVVQGQYIGNVDDTGYSTAHHLHFHVHTNPYSYWGSSVDIRFDDVDINDGTPRTCYEVSAFPNYGTECNDSNIFVSGNYGAYPPSATLILPAAGEEITSSTMLVGGTVADDLGITKIEIMLRPKGSDWIAIDVGSTTSPFLKEINLCELGIPVGPLDIYVRAFDLEGNQTRDYPGFRTVMNNAICLSSVQPPDCVPTANQAAIFSEKDYQGTCKVLDIGGYGNDGHYDPVNNDDVESVMVGDNVRLTVYQNSQDTTFDWGRGEAFEANDPDLEDNLIYLNQASAFLVESRSTLPDTPVINTIFNDFRVPLSATQSFIADYMAYGATEYRAAITGPVNKSISWSKSPSWSFGSLPAGSYTLQVWGRNSAGERSQTKTFIINDASLTNNTTVTVPYSANFDDGAQNWVAADLWHQTTLDYGGRNTGAWFYNNEHIPGESSDIADSNVGGGDLTSPPISIPATGYYLRFDYFYHTESFYQHWDQRRVQISVDGASFEDIYQPYLDPAQVWLSSPAINLSAYAGKTIRLRFHFDIVDSFNNGGYLGWIVDNVSINNTAPEVCNSNEPNNSIGQATQIPESDEIFGHICPNGDLDYYKFYGYSGEDISLDIDAMEYGSQLDPYLFLLDANGNVLASNDDEIYSQDRDSLIEYRLPAEGTYYALVKAWQHPDAGSAEHYYSLRLRKGDIIPPEISFLYPSSSLIPNGTFPIQASAVDLQSDMKRVDFYYRDGDILNASWQLIGTDTNGTDGWSVDFDAQQITNIVNSALYMEAYDVFNNHSGVMMVVDGYGEGDPQSQLLGPNGTIQSTLVNLFWSANEPVTGISHFDIQVQENGGAWQTLVNGLSGYLRQFAYFGAAGSAYKFRMQAVDFSGSEEGFPAAAELSVSLQGCSEDAFEASNEDTLNNAVNFTLSTHQSHNFCGTGDQDWVKFDAVAGTEYMILAAAQGDTTAVNMNVYTNNGSTKHSTYSTTLYGNNSILFWTAPSTETVYLQLLPPDERLAGNDVAYKLWVGEPNRVFLPVIDR